VATAWEGGIYNDGNTAFGVTSLTATASQITHNWAEGGEGDDGRSDGRGVGGGVYSLGDFTFDPMTVIKKNIASTRHNNIGP